MHYFQISLCCMKISKIKFSDRDYRMQSKKIKMDSVLETGFINYISVPSLESIAIVNIVTTVWKQPDLQEGMQEHLSKFYLRRGYSITDRNDSFNEIRKKVSEKLACLLPDSLKSKVYNVIRPIGLQLLIWTNYRKKTYFHFHNCMDLIYWTMEGIIDKSKTLELQYINKNLENYNYSVYSLACKYCSEDFIIYLWKNMSEKTKKDLNNQITYEKTDDLVLYWTCFVKNELPNLLAMINPTNHHNMYDPNHSMYQNMFALSISINNVLAVKYFWHYLTLEEINNNIEKWVDIVAQYRKISAQCDYQKTDECTDILCFLLSQMKDKEQQKRILQKYSDVVLEWLFLDWPWQKFLLPTIQVMWDFLDGRVFVNLLSRIAREIREDAATMKLLKALWCNCPINFKRYFFQSHDDYVYTCMNVFWKLLEIRDLKSIKFILNDATSEEKKQIIFATIAENDKLFELIYENNLSLLDLLVNETLLVEHEIKNFRERVTTSVGGRLCHDWIFNNNLEKAEKFLDWGFSSQDKIDNFKCKIINKVKIVYSLVQQNKYEVASEFMSWCFTSAEEINQFKKKFVYNRNFDVVKNLTDLNSFKNLVHWCFSLAHDMNQFKLDISQYDKLESIIFTIIVYRYGFKYANHLLFWCFNTTKNIKKFKEKFILSDLGMDMFIRFVTNYKVYMYSNWKLVKKLARWFYPLEKKVIIKFRKEAKNVKLTIFGPEKYSPFYSSKGKEHALFHLLDIFAKNNKTKANRNLMGDCLNNEAAHMLLIVGDSSDSIASDDD